MYSGQETDIIIPPVETVKLNRARHHVFVLPVKGSHQLANGTYSLFKRSFDIAFSLLFSILILSWLIPIITLLIRLNSKGPVFFIQKRTGLNGKVFQCIKFRTMRVNDSADIKQAGHEDSRITTVGKFLRNTNLDELPQFFNVLKGDMSVIGPRPHMVYHTGEFSGKFSNYAHRHETKPGITGLAQVKGWRGPTPTFRSVYKRVQWDIYYVNHQSIGLDTYIFVQTLREVISNFTTSLIKVIQGRY